MAREEVRSDDFLYTNEHPARQRTRRDGEDKDERLTPQTPSLCSSLSHSTIAQRVVCARMFLLYSWLALLFGLAFP